MPESIDTAETIAALHPIQQRIDEHNIGERRIFLWGQVDDNSARHVIERLLLLDSESNEDITLLVNSPGGANTAGFAILDTMRSLRSDTATVCLGLAASFGALILTCGTPGKRSAYPHSRIMIHQPWIPGEIRAPAMDLRIHAQEIQRQRQTINAIIADCTGRSIEEIEEDTDRDSWFTAEEAVDYGLIDEVL